MSAEILVDSSVWVEFLRATGSRADEFLQTELDRGRIAITEPVQLELLAGAATRSLAMVAGLLDNQPMLGVAPAEDYVAAAEIYRATRSAGHTPRSLQDCVIAAVAARHGVRLAHRDRDFEAMASATSLTTYDLT